MSNVFFTSDTHFGHANIAGKNTSKWSDGYRHYNSVEEMNQSLVKGINRVVKADDTLYHLGDWSFGGIENIWKFRKQIACENIHLILGNHDHHIEDNRFVPIHEDQRDECFHRFGSYAEIQAENLFKSVSHYKEVKLNGRIFVLSHYSHRIWNGSHKGWFHLYGHSHASITPYGKSMDVGVDTAIQLLGEARPFTVGEVMHLIDKQDTEFPDHHSQDTNAGKKPGKKLR